MTDYIPIGLKDTDVTAFLTIGDLEAFEVTRQQFSLAYNPVVLGIEITRLDVKILNEQRVTLSFHSSRPGQRLAELSLRLMREGKCSIDSSAFYLFQVSGCKLHQLTWIQRMFILTARYIANRKAGKYFGSLPFKLHKQYAAVFTFPRKVVLAIMYEPGFQKVFPIDLHGPVHDGYVFAVRHSNSAVPVLKTLTRIVIASIDVKDYPHVYALGKFGNTTSDSDFNSFNSEQFQFEIPGFVLDYKEIRVVDFEDIGSQCLFYGAITNKVKLRDGNYLHHVHMIEYLENYHLLNDATASSNISRY